MDIHNSKKTLNRLDYSANASMFVYAAAVNAFPICLVKMSEEFSFNLTQAGSLGFFSSLGQVVIFVMSCFAAARFGKIRVLKMALLIVAIGLFLFSFAQSYLAAVFVMLLIGIGNAFLEALLTPLVEDLHPEDSGSKMNLLHAFWPIGVGTSVLLVGELLSRGVSWRIIFASLTLLTLIVFFIYPSSRKVSLPPSRADFSHMGEILLQPRFWCSGICLFFAGAGEFAFAFWSASYIQIRFNAKPRAGALGAAIFALGMVCGRMLSARLVPLLGLKRMIIYSAIGGLFISSSFFLINSLIFLYVFMFFMGLTIACFWPSLQSYSARVLPVDPTVLMIFLSCFGIAGTSVCVLIMGIIGDNIGLHQAFLVAPLSLVLLLVFLLLEEKLKIKPIK